MNDIFDKIQTKGRITKIKNKKTKECIGLSCIINGDFNYNLNKNQKWYINKKFRRYKDNLDKVIKILKKDINSRQAILCLQADRDMWPECLCSIQFLVRDKKLFVIAYFRSLDVENKFSQDVEIIRRFSKKIEDELNINLFLIKIFIGSAHYYI